MTDSNRLRMTLVKESTLGATPDTPRMRTMRVTGEGLQYTPNFVNSNEIRSDRMLSDPIKVNEQNSGPINFELSYPVSDSPLSSLLESTMFNSWANTPAFDNDGTADSVVTDAGTTTDTYVVAANGDDAKAGHLVRATGFTNAANNQVFKVVSATGTTIVGSSLSLTAETAPPATARLKVVGFQGASADISAAADGLTSSSLDFTTLGLAVGQWIKIGGSAAGDKFATAACNGWARITAIATNALTLDNLPSGWTTDAGTGKTVKVWFGDQLKNGVSRISHTIERGFMGQAVPTYIIQRGMVVGQATLNFTTEQVISGTFTMNGLTGEQTTSALDASPDAETSNPIMSANVNVGRIAESGVAVTSPNFVRSAQLSFNNNLRMITAVGNVGAVDIGVGEFAVDVTLETYFGSNALLAKLLAGTVGNINLRTAKNSQAVILALPRLTFTGGAPSAGSKNTDVMLNLTGSVSKDTLTAASAIINRLEYFEA
ncbi:MAG: hypothetical protein J0I98_06525 [Mesorhizobium sp.]|nr:hypothetical protein [Mesorhizobium sp.]